MFLQMTLLMLVNKSINSEPLSLKVLDDSRYVAVYLTFVVSRKFKIENPIAFKIM